MVGTNCFPDVAPLVTMEVVIAYLVTNWLWSLYHTLTIHPMVREEVESMWWGKLIIYLETGWNGPVPDKAGCSFSLETEAEGLLWHLQQYAHYVERTQYIVSIELGIWINF